ncbi:MAG: VanW family protein [Bacteroidia bacterium]|nr:VanW family protein [Bacteroidia bacterium]
MVTHNVNKPVVRSTFRKQIGKEYFILKRKINWLFGSKNFASQNAAPPFSYSLIKHQSFLLRPLKGVDMYLQHNKAVNLKLAIRNIDGVIIRPGETFSVWKMVGRPTASKGYLEGLVLDNGNISKGIGGGLCQLGNLLYWMALHTPLTIKERWRHGFDVFPDINRTIPFACGATLSYNYVDLQLLNATDKTFCIHLWIDEEYLHGEITCNEDLKQRYEVFETDHLIKQQWWGGYTRHNKIWKRITNLSDLSRAEELVAENNAIMMYSPLLQMKNNQK